MGWLGDQPCCACPRPSGPPHHKTGAGMARRAHDHDAMPMCPDCHNSIHSTMFGFFKGWEKAKLQRYQDNMVKMYRKLYAEGHAAVAQDAVCEEIF